MRRALWLCILVLRVSMGQGVFAADLDASQNLDYFANGNTWIDIQLTGNGDQDVVRDAGRGGWDFDNRDGAGADVDPPGLNLGARYLYATRAPNSGTGSSIVLYLNGGNIVGSNATAFSTSFNDQTGNIQIYEVADIEMGGIDTRTTRNYQGYSSGDLVIGEEGDRAGNIKVAFIYTATCPSGQWGGDVTIYGSGDVRIEDAGDTAGSIDSHSLQNPGTGGTTPRGVVLVNHDGVFVSENIYTYAAGNNSLRTGSVTLEGNALDGQPGDHPLGSCTVGAISTYETLDHNLAAGCGRVHISGYSSVETGAIRTYNAYAVSRAGNVTFEDIAGDIQITGAIDLHGDTPSAGGATLSLTCGGTITLASLDLDLVKVAMLNAGTGRSFIHGPLSHFSGANDPSLRAPAGQMVFYDRDSNPELGGATYPLQDEHGVDNAGGKLRAWPSLGLVVIFR